MSARSSDRSRATTSDARPSGLFVANNTGREHLAFSDQEISDDIIATIPKLHAAVRRDTLGKKWKPKQRKDGVEFFEMSALGAAEEPNDDLDVVHAVVAKTELKCHLNEVLNVLLNLESDEYEATMKALSGSKFKRGDVLFQQKCVFTPSPDACDATKAGKEAVTQQQQQGMIAVKMATLQPKMNLSLKSRHKRTQKLCFSTFTHQYPTKDRAVHIMKTLPKHVHDQIVPSEDRSSLRREIDHLNVGFDIQSTHRVGGSINQTTRVFAYGYASATSPSSFGKLTAKQLSISAQDIARRREAIMNPEARNVLSLLTESLTQFERVIRRRRFGFQSFIYFPKEYEDPNLLKSCSICCKTFSFFRRDFFCQLCGHMVCNDCSQLYEVEARIGEVRKNRACLQCVLRVDSCKFDDEELLPALGELVVTEMDDEEWFNDDLFHLGDLKYDHDQDDDTLSITSDSSELDEITDQLYSQDPATRSNALETLSRIISPAAKQEYKFQDPKAAKLAEHKKKPKTHTEKVMQDVEKHLSQSLRVVKDQYLTGDSSTALVVSDRERDYKYEYDSTKTVNAHHPLPPMPSHEKETKRLELIKESGVLTESYDTSALDLIAQVAAKRMNCPIGFVSVVDEEAFHAIGKYQLPEVAYTCPRNENMCIHTVYAEKPLIVKNPQRDMRFAQLSTVQDLGVKFYAGFPVRAPDGSVVASLCAADSVAHNNISAKDYATMEALAQLASELVVPATKFVNSNGLNKAITA
uniref:FYVE-type domain-containing protein n=1 Tax=Globisporangium ultimum (strain ATCC 200006 / CBS 805.95 / DAOM BR144) TaxID=431595 RepID=K3W655_GLOUD